MYAAPTASQDFQILIIFEQKIWKDKISFINSLIDQLQNKQNPEKIQICFLEMMKNTSVNIIKKVIKLIHKYIILYGIQILSLKELSLSILNASLVDAEVQTVIKCLFISAKIQQQRNLIMEAMKKFCDGSRQKNNILIIQIYGQLLPLFSLKELCYLHYLQECLMQMMNSISEVVENVLYLFFKFLFNNIGSNAILLMRKINYGFVNKIKKQSSKIDINFQNVENVSFDYVYKLGSESWLEDFNIIHIKYINQTLKQAQKQIQEGIIQLQLSEQLIISLIFIARKKNNTINKSIYQIIVNILNRQFLKSNSKQLFNLLFQLLSNKRVVKKIFQQQNKIIKQKTWLSTITAQNISSKIQSSTLQQEYHRLILLLEFYKRENNQNLKDQVQILKGKNNLSHVYKVKLDHISKQNNQQKQN